MRSIAAVSATAGLLLLIACGGGGGGSPLPATSTTVGVAAPTPTAPASSGTPAPGTSASASPGASASPSAGPSASPSVTPSPSPSPIASPTPTATPSNSGVADSTTPSIVLNDAFTLGDPSTYNHTGATTTAPIDGIPCTRALETVPYHEHGHISLFVNGKQYAIPAAIGIYHPAVEQPAAAGFWNIDPNDPTSCHYFVHVHNGDGVIHMESPTATNTAAVFTLKQFLDIWGVSLSTTGFWTFTGPTHWFLTDERVGVAGTYTVHEITGVDPSTVYIERHQEITIEVGTPLVNIPNYSFANGL